MGKKRIVQKTISNDDIARHRTTDSIHDGIVQFVRAGQFDPTLSFEKIIKDIDASPLSIAFMVEHDTETVVDFKLEFWECFSGHNKTDEEPVTNSKQLLHTGTKLFVSTDFKNGKYILQLDVDNPIVNSMKQELTSYITRLNSSNQYGAFTKIPHRSFLLAPILKTEPSNPIGALTEFTVFQNGLFCITVTAELREAPIDQICENRCSGGVDNALLPLCCNPEHRMRWGYFDSKTTYDIKEIADIWLNTLGAMFNDGLNISDESHRILYMLDFDGMLDNYEQVDPADEYKWLIFRILHSPIDEFNKRPPEIWREAYSCARYRMTTNLEVYSSTIYRTIVASGKDRSAVAKLILENNGGAQPEDSIVRSVLRNSIIGAILPAVQIEMLSAFSLETITKSCRNIEKKTLRSLLQIRQAAYDASLQYYDSHRVNYDSLRELTDFLSSRHSHSSALEQHEKVIEQFDRAVQFRENLASSKRSQWLSIILAIFSIVGSLGQIISVLSAMNEGAVLFSPGTTKKEVLLIAIIAWSCIILLAAIGLLMIKINKRKR